MIDERFIILGCLLNLIGSFQYFISTLKGKVKPNKISWLMWGIAPLIAFFAQSSQGAGWQSLLALTVGTADLAIFAACFFNKKAYWKLRAFDFLCGILSITGLVLWYLTKIGNIALFFAILADFIASIPTLVKSYSFPNTENYKVYLATAVNSLIVLLTINTWTFAYYGFSAYLLLINIVFILFIKFKFGIRKSIKNISL